MKAAKSRLIPWALAGVSFVACTVFAGDYPTEWDSVQLVFGLDRFDVTQDSPHPPGYWLYVSAARVVRAATPLSGTRALQLLAALATAATVGLTTALGRRVGGPWLGMAAGAFLLTSPFVLFYGSIPSSYPFDALLAVSLVLLALAARPRSWHAPAAAALLGIGAGFRQTSLVVLGPLALWAAVKSVRSVPAAVTTVAAGSAGVLLWFVPMLAEQPGGWNSYRSYSSQYLENALSRSSPFHGAPGDLVVRNVLEGSAYTFVAVATLLPLFAAGLAVVVARRRARSPLPREAIVLLVLAVVGPALFAIVVHFGKAGYVNGYLPGLVLLLLLPCTLLPRRVLAVTSVVLAGVCLLQVQRWTVASYVLPLSQRHQALWFTDPQYGWPYPLTWQEIKKTDRETGQNRALRRRFDPGQVVLVYVQENGGYRFRHANLTLPGFTAHYVTPPIDASRVLDRRTEPEFDGVIEVPPGGQAVWLLDLDPPEMAEQVALGLLHTEEVDGRLVWIADPGARVYGVSVEVSAGAVRARG